MIGGNLGSISLEQKSILIGQNHIVVSYKVKDGIDNLTAGSAVMLADGEITHLTADTDDAIGVLYQSIELEKGKKTKDATGLVVVFGAVKKDDVTFTSSATPCTAQLIEKLRKNGIYAIN